MTTSNNHLTINGIVSSEPEPFDTVRNKVVYKMIIESPRLSDTSDYIPIIFTEDMHRLDDLVLGVPVEVSGRIQSFNLQEKLVLVVCTTKVTTYDDFVSGINNVSLTGFICKKPIYRVTPLNREIADILIAVSPAPRGACLYCRSSYIPIIAWGKNARLSQSIRVGTEVIVVGRFQSRVYEKKLSEHEVVRKTALEVSVSKMYPVRNT